jgi:hypothetical protein
MQRAISGWESVSRDSLRLPSGRAPWMVFYNAACVWHVGFEVSQLDPSAVRAPTALSWKGAALEIRVAAHNGLVRLPDGSDWPARENTAHASFYGGTEATFFVVATPDAWRRDPNFASDPMVDEFFLGVTIHELTHTRHLPLLITRLQAVAARSRPAKLSLDDDVIQKTFGGNADIREAFEAERDVFFEAAASASREPRRALIRKGLDLARARRARYFTDENQYYQELEDIFLSMEGAGQWASYVFARRSRSAADAVAFVRDNKKYWSQDEGLALFLLLDLEVPRWQATIFSANDPGPFALLERTLADEPRE